MIVAVPQVYTLQAQRDGAAVGVPEYPIPVNVSCAAPPCWAVWPYQHSAQSTGDGLGVILRVPSVSASVALMVAVSVGNASSAAHFVVTASCVHLDRCGDVLVAGQDFQVARLAFDARFLEGTCELAS